MNFKVNDVVLYGTAGACRITNFSRQKFAGVEREYYELRPVYDEKSTLFVPADNQTLIDKMKRILSVEEIYQLIHGMPEEGEIWIDDEKKRNEKYRDIIAKGDREELIRLIKTLYLYKQRVEKKGKRLHAGDEKVLNDAQKILYDEFAHVLKINPSEVVDFINRELGSLQEKA